MAYTIRPNDGHDVTATGDAVVTITVDGIDQAPVANSDYILNAPTGFTFNSANGHYYEFVNTAVGIGDAIAALHRQAVYLATITSLSEENFVSSLVGNNSAWFGATDAGQPGQWQDFGGPEDGTPFWVGGG